MKSEKKDDAHEAHPEVQIEEVFQKLFEEKGVKADPPDPLYRLCKTL